jgi:recombination protein RecR
MGLVSFFMFLSDDLQQLIHAFCKLPGIGPRSARRVVLHLIKNKHPSMAILHDSLKKVAESHHECSLCGYIDARNPCFFCTSSHRDPSLLCIVADTGDVWAFEKGCFFKGQYHVLGGVISAFHGKRPQDLNLASLQQRLSTTVKEVILAMDGTLEGQTTLNYVTQSIAQWAPHIRISGLAKGMPVGGEFDYMDQGTLISAFTGRQKVPSLAESIAQWK